MLSVARLAVAVFDALDVNTIGWLLAGHSGRDQRSDSGRFTDKYNDGLTTRIIHAGIIDYESFGSWADEMAIILSEEGLQEDLPITILNIKKVHLTPFCGMLLGA